VGFEIPQALRSIFPSLGHSPTYAADRIIIVPVVIIDIAIIGIEYPRIIAIV
jgi:hypothetical protein